MFVRLIVILILLSACGSPSAKVKSYQARIANDYVYLLSHTAHIADTGSDNTDIDFASHGQCFYKVVSPRKLRLHRQDDLQTALASAEKVTENFLPLSQVKKTIVKDRTLQELYASERHWLFPTVGTFAALMLIVPIDSFLHRGNEVVVENSQRHIVDKFAKGNNKSLRRQIYEVLHLTAKVEHETDELVRQAATMGGSKNPLKRINHWLIDSKLSQGIANLWSRKCIGKRAAVCLVAYLIGFNSLFVVGVPVIADRVANGSARIINRKAEQQVLHDLLTNQHTLQNAQATSDKVMKTFLKKLEKIDSSAPPCPEASALPLSK